MNLIKIVLKNKKELISKIEIKNDIYLLEKKLNK